MKLNKSQIEAIASKIEFERNSKFKEEVAKKVKQYMPDALKIMELNKQESSISEQRGKIFSKYSGRSFYGCNTLEQYAETMCEIKEKIISHSHQKIVDSLIIASVDAADMDALMKNYEKFLI